MEQYMDNLQQLGTNVHVCLCLHTCTCTDMYLFGCWDLNFNKSLSMCILWNEEKRGILGPCTVLMMTQEREEGEGAAASV
jgi:hypothetical protein